MKAVFRRYWTICYKCVCCQESLARGPCGNCEVKWPVLHDPKTLFYAHIVPPPATAPVACLLTALIRVVSVTVTVRHHGHWELCSIINVFKPLIIVLENVVLNFGIWLLKSRHTQGA